MKKMFLLISTVCSSLFLFAQKPVLGFKGGLNIANWHVETGQETFDPRFGFHLGVFAHTHLTDQIAFQPEVQFSTQGTKQQLIGGNGKYVSKMNYINVPLMLQYMFDNGFRVEAGPQIGFLLSAKNEAPNGVETNSTGNYKTVDAGLGIGINYLMYSGWGIGGRYIFGLSDIDDAGTYKRENRNFQISVFRLLDANHKRKSR